MHFFNTIASFAALAAFITPVFSAPVAEPSVDTTSLVVRGGHLKDSVESCHQHVKEKCDHISEKIEHGHEGKIDVDIAAVIVAELEVIVELFVQLGVDLKAKIEAGGLDIDDVKASIIAIIAIVNVTVSILVKIQASLLASVSLSVFAAVLVKLAASVQVVINLFIGVCASGVLSIAISEVIEVLVQLIAVLKVFVSACGNLGITV